MEKDQQLEMWLKGMEKLITRAWSDELFRARLMKSPAKTVEEEFAIEVPDFINVRVLEETADTRYIIVPYRPGDESDELLDEDLEAVSGGPALGTIEGPDEVNYTCPSMPGNPSCRHR